MSAPEATIGTADVTGNHHHVNKWVGKITAQIWPLPHIADIADDSSGSLGISCVLVVGRCFYFWRLVGAGHRD